MDIRVDDEYYCNVCDYYSGQIELVEECLEEFRQQCDSLFKFVRFGAQLSIVLRSKCDTFYSSASGQLSSLLESVKNETNDFLDLVEKHDVLS